MDTENWLPVIGYEGLYEISNLGRIKSLFKERTFGLYSKNKRRYEEKIMKTRLSNNGYELIVLCKNGISKTMTVHRLVGFHFVMNMNSKPEINHINGIKTDNRFDNLEWCTSSENINHAVKNGFMKSLFTSKNNPSNKKVLHEDTGKIYGSIAAASIGTGISVRSIYHQLDGSQKNKNNFKKL